jgi:hypothetical protein
VLLLPRRFVNHVKTNIQISHHARKPPTSPHPPAMASGPLSLAVGEPIRNEKIPKSQQRSAVLQSVAPQLRDAAERGAAAPIASISDFLSSLSEGAKNPKANMNAMRLLIETRQTRPKDAQSPASAARDAARDEDAVLFRSGDVRFVCPIIHVSCQ